jgi:hypothetical protein
MSRRGALLLLALLGGAPAGAQPLLQAERVRTYEAAEANQGVAVDAGSIYAIGNSEIGRYDKRTGKRTGGWTGDPKVFPHLNSCAPVGAELVCASSNYPATPMASTVEVFDRARLTHLRSIPLGRQAGSLTWVLRKDNAWWAGFANYDGRGGEPGRDHSFTALVKFDDAWKPVRQWSFPRSVLDRFAPRSASGGVWGDRGLLYVSGHDRAEIYVLRLPRRGDVLEHAATIASPIEGQAIALDPADHRMMYGVSRKTREVVATRLPDLGSLK